jgi:hypothetical protein
MTINATGLDPEDWPTDVGDTFPALLYNYSPKRAALATVRVEKVHPRPAEGKTGYIVSIVDDEPRERLSHPDAVGSYTDGVLCELNDELGDTFWATSTRWTAYPVSEDARERIREREEELAEQAERERRNKQHEEALRWKEREERKRETMAPIKDLSFGDVTKTGSGEGSTVRQRFTVEHKNGETYEGVVKNVFDAGTLVVLDRLDKAVWASDDAGEAEEEVAAAAKRASDVPKGVRM